MNSFKNNINSFKGYDRVNQEQERLQHRRKTRKRIAIIVASSIVLILIVVAAVAGTLISRSKDTLDSPATTSIFSQNETIKAVCSVTLYPSSCIASLSSVADPRTTDPEHLFQISLQVAFRELSNVYGLPGKLAGTVKDNRTKLALLDCQEMIDDAMDQLNSSILVTQKNPGENILSQTKVDDLRTWLSSVITNMDSCLDGLDNTTGGFRERMESALSNSTQFTSNSLAIVSKIFSILETLNIPLHRRLLGFPGKQSSPLASEFPAWLMSKDRKLLQENLINSADIVVAQDGSGTETSISEAIKKVPLKSTKRFIIHIKAGKYVEKIVIDNKRQNVILIGDGMDTTIISGSLNHLEGSTTFSTAPFAVTGKGFMARDIKFENTAGPSKEQAAAIRVGSDHSVFFRCKFEGYQDTLYAHSNRQFYKDCTISGTVDFIFGDAAVVFQNCLILARQPMSNQKNTVTAQGRTDPNQNTGISIHECQIDGNDVTAPTYLGRPWKPYSLTVIMKTKIGSVVNPAGWLLWQGTTTAPDTIFYAEYQNEGPGSGTANRVTWKGYNPAISDSVAEKYTVDSFISGNQWIPNTGVTYSAGL